MIESWANCPLPIIPKDKRIKNRGLGICKGGCNSLKQIYNAEYQLCANCRTRYQWFGAYCPIPTCESDSKGKDIFVKYEDMVMCQPCAKARKNQKDYSWERFIENRVQVLARPATFQKTTYPKVSIHKRVALHSQAECAKCKVIKRICSTIYQFCTTCRKSEQYVNEICWCCNRTTVDALGMGFDTDESIFVCILCQRKRGKYKLSSYSVLKNQIKTRLNCDICSKVIIHTGRQSNSAYIDHDHKTEVVRGVLCASCNTIDGFIKDNDCPEIWAKNYMNYLENPPLDIHGIH